MEYKLTDSPVLIEKLFDFLHREYEFKLVEKEVDNSGVLFIYRNNYVKVGISFDYRDYFLSIDLIQGKDTQYPNDNREKIKDVSELLIRYNVPNIPIEDLRSSKEQGFMTALRLSSEILQMYGGKILKGTEWF